MNKTTSIWTAVLTFSAVIMAAILLATNQREAQGAMINAQTGFTLMTTGVNGGDEALIVIDKTSQKMLIYNLNGNNLELLAGRSFK